MREATLSSVEHGWQRLAPASNGANGDDDRIELIRLDRADEHLYARLLEAVDRVASRGQFTLGEEVERFEQDFAAYCEIEHAVGVSSGTDALALALRGLDIGVGDDVLVPASSFIATAEAVTLVGAQPVFVDVDPVTHLVTAAILEEAWTPRTKVIIPVHQRGATVEIEQILDLAADRGAAVVEDACQAHGARYKGARVGTFGAFGCFSFYPSKNLGGWGDGGAIVTPDAKLAERVRLLRSHGEAVRYQHQVAGTTGRLHALQAALLRIKLEFLDRWNSERRRLARELAAELLDADVELPASPVADGDHVYHQYAVGSSARDELRSHLEEQGIATGVHYPVPIHLTEAYRRAERQALPVTERIAATTCTLPLWPGMTREYLERIAAAVRQFHPRSEA